MRLHRKQIPLIASSALLVLLCACQRPAADADTASAQTSAGDKVTPVEQAPPPGAPDPMTGFATPVDFVWPQSLTVIGDGYPNPGDACRRIGESEATRDMLDDAADLVGCPGTPDDSAATVVAIDAQGQLVGEVDGVTLLSVPVR